MMLRMMILLVSCTFASPANEGDKAFKSGDYKLAVENYEQALKENPEDLSLKFTSPPNWVPYCREAAPLTI